MYVYFNNQLYLRLVGFLGTLKVCLIKRIKFVVEFTTLKICKSSQTVRVNGVKTKSTTELRELKTQEQRRATSGGNGCNEDLQACFSSVILRSLSSQPLTPPPHIPARGLFRIRYPSNENPWDLVGSLYQISNIVGISCYNTLYRE